ncbi:hypothetical protein [Spirosoma jeollabukense]
MSDSTSVKSRFNRVARAICLSVIDTDGRVVVKGSTKVANKLAAFAQLEHWVSKHCKKAEGLPLRYVMELTGVSMKL